jgi:hypothetical protein
VAILIIIVLGGLLKSPENSYHKDPETIVDIDILNFALDDLSQIEI